MANDSKSGKDLFGEYKKETNMKTVTAQHSNSRRWTLEEVSFNLSP